MDKAALKEFRAKLVKARRNLRRHTDEDNFVWLHTLLHESGLPISAEVRVWSDKNYHKNNYPKKCAALFTNSIAAIDKQISELHQ